MRYKNISSATLEFYGVTFGPGEVKEVPGPINTPQFIRTNEPLTVVPAKADAAITNDAQKRTTKSTTQKKEASSDGTNSD